MSLQFIFGNSGSGKSYTLYQKIIADSIRCPDQNYLVIVPEQFTMQTQRDLVLLHPKKGIMNIDVLSFRRLAHRVFEEVGADGRTVLTETGKNLMLRRVAEQQKDQLQVLGARLSRIGYVSEIKSVLSELMQYEITDFDLAEMIQSVRDRPLLKAKLEDIRVLYRAFLAYQKDRFMKPEELMEVLAQVAGRSELLKHSVLAFDGFAGFTPAQIHVLGELLAICPKVYLTVTIDAREDFFGEIREHELFAPSRRLIRSVADIAEEGRENSAGLKYEEPIVLGREKLPRFSENGALRHLEQNLFRSRQTPYEGDSDEISLHALSSPVQEVHFAARTISQLVRKGPYRYRDIAVIAGDLSAYGNYVKRIFPMYGIPAFVDETHGLLFNPCLEFVRSALVLAEEDFSRESVFRFLRTGMAGFSSEDTDRLENHVLAAGIRGRRQWEQEWDWCPANESPEELAVCNELRRRLMERTGPFIERMQGKHRPLLEYASALFQLLTDCGVQQQLKERELALRAAGERETAAEYSQVYAIVISLLDEMADLLGEEQMDCREFAGILDAGLAEAKIGIIPPGIDQVQVGDIRRSRLANVRVLFFIGLNDGWVPSRGSEGGIVSDAEREILLSHGADLAPSARENSYIQRFYLYQNLTKPEDRLYLSWCAGSGEGMAMRPSYLVSNILRLFPKAAVHQEQDAGSYLQQVTSKENGMLYLLNGLQKLRDPQRQTDDGTAASWLELYREYLNDEDYCGRVRELTEAAFADVLEEQQSLDPQTARTLYSPAGSQEENLQMTASVTRLEQFAGCAFSHFASYGLRLQERAVYGVNAADLGTLFHEAMALFSREMRAEGLDWGECPYEEEAARMDRCAEQAAASYGGGILHQSAREEYTIRRLKRILRRTIWVTREQIRAGQFHPVGFEISFANTEDLDAVKVAVRGGGNIRLQGRIDRIDTVETEDAVYVKVVDYKSGQTKFDLVPLYYGLQVQLVVYLNAAMEMERKLHPDKAVIPAGIFYSRIQDPVLEKEASPQRARENLLKKMRPDGLINGDGPILQLLDQHIGGDSLVIPAALKKDGTPKAFSSLATTEEFSALLTYVTELLGVMGNAILQGSIEARPFVYKNRSTCDYCAFADICGFDRKIPGRCAGRTPALAAPDVVERLSNAEHFQDDRRGLPPNEGEGAIPERLSNAEHSQDDRRDLPPNEGEGAILERLSNAEHSEEEGDDGRCR